MLLALNEIHLKRVLVHSAEVQLDGGVIHALAKGKNQLLGGMRCKAGRAHLPHFAGNFLFIYLQPLLIGFPLKRQLIGCLLYTSRCV